MFRNDLRDRLENIFQFKKTTFDAPSEEYEQETLFIEIEACRPRVSGKAGGLQTARVVGNLVCYSQDNKLTYGYFIKAIEQATIRDRTLTAPFFFYDIDVDLAESPARMVNIHERRVSFIFFYSSQYDPDKGELSDIEFTFTED